MSILIGSHFYEVFPRSMSLEEIILEQARPFFSPFNPNYSVTMPHTLEGLKKASPLFFQSIYRSVRADWQRESAKDWNGSKYQKPGTVEEPE